jgi:hypothetical protein
MMSPERSKCVGRELIFHEAISLVEFHHAGHLDSYEADVKEAARVCLYRAFAITEDVDRHHSELVGNCDRRMSNAEIGIRVRRQYLARVEGLRQIRELMPELVALNLGVNFSDLRELVQAAYRSDVICRASLRVRHTRARKTAMSIESLLDEFEEEGVDRNEWGIKAICTGFVEEIRVYAPELVLNEDGEASGTDATDIYYSMGRVILQTAWVCE